MNGYNNAPAPLNDAHQHHVDGKYNNVQPEIVPLVIPIPETVIQLQHLLRRYRELESSNTYPAERIGILNTLRDVSKQQGTYENDLQELEDLWKSNTEEVNVDLLKEQIIALQLLSKNIDLPLKLQTKFSDILQEEEENFTEEEEEDDDEEDEEAVEEEGTAYSESEENNINAIESETTTGANADEIKSNDGDSLSIELPFDDYDVKAKMLGIPPTRTIPNPALHSVGSNESEALVSKKISGRIIELENLPANIGTYDINNINNDLNSSSDQVIEGVDELKIRSLIELKALRLLPKQKEMRQKIVQSSITASVYKTETVLPTAKSLGRSYFIREKKKIEQTARLAEKLQEQQRKEKEALERDLQRQYVTQLSEIFAEAQNELAMKKNSRYALGRSVHHYHQQVEKDEGRRLERTAKQRLAALKSNDEEAYLKLLDQTKDTRITHLLKQTNSFLDSLASAVQVQQQESKVLNQIDKGEEISAPTAEPVVGVGEDEDEDSKREKIDYYEVAHKIRETVTSQPKILTGGTLKEYQLKGLEWMVSLYNNNLNGILADEMGLGKTIQSISLISYLYEVKKERGKFLVIVPLSTITNWTLEFEKWAPSLNTIVYKGTQQQRKLLQYQVRTGNFTVLLTTYEYVIRDRPLLSKFRWAHMIIDEGHRMKNASSKLSITLTQYYHTRNRLILTGTPLQNNLPELWALLNFILPKVFNSVKSFDEWFNTPFANTGHQDKLELTEEESLLVIRRLHKVLRPFLLRRLKRDVEKDLPDKVEKVIKCQLSGLQSCMYKQMLTHNALFVGAGTTGATKSGLKGLNNKIMQLRKVCNHPFVFEEVEDLVNPQRLTTDMIWRSSGKFELLQRVLPKFKATGHRVLIFFQMTQVMDIMEDYLRFMDMKYMRLDGSTKADDRQLMLKDFNAPQSEYFCFLLSTRAGGLGLNLQTADTVIIFDTDWNPHQDLQAQDRAHRIGQKNEVRILRLITEDSVEEVILERAHQKLDIDGKVIQAGKFDNKSSAEEQEAFLKRLLDAEKDKSDEAEDDELDDDDLNDILARTEDEKILFTKMDRERAKADKLLGGPRLMSLEELPAVFKEDISVHINKSREQLAAKRERKSVMYDDGLTEEQWLDAVDNDDDTIEDAIRRKQASAKRRNAKKSREDDDEDGDDENISDPAPPKKRSRKNRKSVEPESELDHSFDEVSDVKPEQPFVKLCLKLLDDLTGLEDEEGRSRSELFMTVPPRKLYPDYYILIKQAVSINDLKKALKKREFDTLDEFTERLTLMFENAKTYNEEGSLVYEDAVKLQEFASNSINNIKEVLKSNV
ncbi:hypothetical protein CANARDRAFT_26638 [[Candida] arabinofermentans NRRL YB-2248]|uniref:Nuclear protein STH1/NPS1 n=1 Tax=[Candida] arabinofermentans NRRL YB-2248 TaxID=983967 RepID=A0A1E4T627_9ASCO|nr:hypothetical protein CANARDRAFT_26638 [[Candida] arabinofermentans NRRL YB-2248]